jgi:hypothetical protein
VDAVAVARAVNLPCDSFPTHLPPGALFVNCRMQRFDIKVGIGDLQIGPRGQPVPLFVVQFSKTLSILPSKPPSV